MKQTLQLNPLSLLKLSLNNLFQNPVIIYPTITLAFIQLLTIEILYFTPRYPFSEFFGPLIRYVWSEDFLHYPQDLVLLPKMFYYAQIFIYLFIGSYLIGVTSRIVAILNERPKINLKTAFDETFQQYVPILCASALSFLLFQFASKTYTSLLTGLIRSRPAESSTAFLSKLFLWTPYAQFFIGIFITTLLVFIVPVIVIEKKKILPALMANFITVLKTFPTTFLVVFIPTMFYLPVLALRNNIEGLISRTTPDIQVLVIVAGILVTTAIDLVIITAVTTYYLYILENHEKSR